MYVHMDTQTYAGVEHHGHNMVSIKLLSMCTKRLVLIIEVQSGIAGWGGTPHRQEPPERLDRSVNT